MVFSIITNLMPKGMNKGAYRGELTCPVCDSQAIRFVENYGPHRKRYRCRKCGMPFQYDISARLNHPYAPFAKQSKFKDLIHRSKGGPKGG